MAVTAAKVLREATARLHWQAIVVNDYLHIGQYTICAHVQTMPLLCFSEEHKLSCALYHCFWWLVHVLTYKAGVLAHCVQCGQTCAMYLKAIVLIKQIPSTNIDDRATRPVCE
jgi:hypothetical protein